VEYKSAFDFLSGILTNLLYPNEIRSASAIAIGNFADERSIPLLQAILENPGESGELRMYAAYGIGRTGSSKAFDILAPYIEDEKVDLNIRLWGISGLSYVNDQRVVKKLIDFTKVDNMKVRLEAIRSLSRYEKSQEVIEVLKYKALYDPEFSVKKEAKNLLKKLGIDVESSETNQSSSQSSGKK
jgi:HEAT repeat protein